MHHRVIIPDNRGNARGNAHLVNASVRPVQLAAIITTSNGGWLGSFCQPPVGIVLVVIRDLSLPVKTPSLCPFVIRYILLPYVNWMV